ncbi:uncharacterized protein LOC112341382 [Selaginella moellendorffii]|uniref:uncharacterized protein LOC112341382 n=1 Tax=Selaginella moellendorffii TaxID=88036 RepID=UPI000D1C6F3F|nr:uncharacterized protein LOC112341382 [Selaginella moellendorffii]|eukprot:XP_024517135.1 uncharacterized protein LOC112341382 [Selaginella moellendorffii]
MEATNSDEVHFSTAPPKRRIQLPDVHDYGSTTEGLGERLQRSFYSPRTHTVNKLLRLVDTVGTVQMRAPPQSGKTSLLQLADAAARRSPRWKHVYFISLASIHLNFDEQFVAKYSKGAFNDLFEPGGPKRLLIVDEADGSYADEMPLWNVIRSMQEEYRNKERDTTWIPNLKIIISSGFGAETVFMAKSAPGKWNDENRVLLRPAGSHGVAIQLSDLEAIEVWTGWLAHNGLPQLSDGLRDYVFRMTDKQPGVLAHVLELLESRGAGTRHPYAVEDQLWSKFSKPEFLSGLSELRSICIFHHLVHEAPYHAVAMKLLKFDKVPDSIVRNEERGPMYNMVLRGQAIKSDDGYYSMISLAHDYFYRKHLYKRGWSARRIDHMGIKKFMRRLLKQINPAVLRNCSGDALEKIQVGIHRALCAVLKQPLWPNIDLGPRLEGRGLHEFYVQDIGWLIELETEVLRKRDLNAKVMEGERYHSMRKKKQLKAYVFIDVTKEMVVTVYRDFAKEFGKRFGAKFVAVLFSDDFESATLFPDEITVPFCGHKTDAKADTRQRRKIEKKDKCCHQ